VCKSSWTYVRILETFSPKNYTKNWRFGLKLCICAIYDQGIVFLENLIFCRKNVKIAENSHHDFDPLLVWKGRIFETWRTAFEAGLPDDIQICIPKIPNFGIFYVEGPVLNNRYILWSFGIFYGRLVYFMVIWYILWSFGIFYGHLVHFMFIGYILWSCVIFNGHWVYFMLMCYI
jgi:hypothetical protein